MKKMMTNMKTLVALLMAGAAVTSCSSDNEMDSLKAPAGKTYTMTVQATKGGDATTRALADGDDGTLTATWATTENVYVKKDDTWATGSLKPQADGAIATLKGELSGVTIAANDVLTLQFPKSGDITYAGQKGTLADIAENFDWAIAEDVQVASVDADGNIDTGENAIEFEHQQAIVRFTLKKSDGTALPSNPTAFTMTDGTSTVELTNIPAGTYTTNGGDGVLYVAFPASNVSADITLTATVGTDTYTCTASSKTFTIGNFYRVTAKMAEPEVAGSYFTANSSGLKVVFSQGNLQATYDGSTWTWAFAEHQYDYIGNAEGNTKVTDASPYVSDYSGSSTTVDLFGWVGASSTWDGVNRFGITSAGSDYLNKTNGYGNVPDENMKAEWNSTHLTITNGGTYTWRTLTGGEGGEWDWIIGELEYANPGTNCRASGATINGISKVRYTLATINTDGTPVNGIILFPDGCKINSSSATSWGDFNTGSEWDNATKCTEAQWTHLEELGCVFLPAAGYRKEAEVDEVGTDGYYWSSSPYVDPDDPSSESAHYVYFGSGGAVPEDYNDRYYGYSVRLVRVVP